MFFFFVFCFQLRASVVQACILCGEHSEVTISAVLYMFPCVGGAFLQGPNVFQQGPINLELILFFTTVI